jgi:predicted small secreted protein
MRLANRTARWAILLGLIATLAGLSACNTLKGAGKDIQKIGEGVETGVKTVEDEVTN